MFQLSPIVVASALGLAGCSIAQQYPPPVTYDTVLKSPINPNITISYKEPDPGTCTTVFPAQKQYTGYVNLPPFTLEPFQQDYSINTFFWFFEARTEPETAPLTVWLNGGPGSSSMIGLFREAGPCEVVQLADGSYGTQASTFGWDRSSNVLFIDQPTQVGFSYDEAVNSTVDFRTGVIAYPKSLPRDDPPWVLANGTLSSLNPNNTQNSTVIAARAAWHFLQGFLSAFPQYNPGQHPNRTTVEPVGVNLFAESYGGQYGPTFGDFFEDQNERRRTGEIPANSTLEIKLSSVGIINGLVDALIQAPSLGNFTYNNTYGIQAIDQTEWLNLISDFKAPGGCQDLVTQCRKHMAAGDTEGESFDAATSSVCAEASNACYGIMGEAINEAGRSAYDIRVMPPNSFPSYAYLEYLNSADVLRSIGAKVNYTETSTAVYNAFGETGDIVRGTQVQKLADLLARGVRVAFIYGDADIICNWYGGEAVSLAVARLSAYNTTFPAAGYADIVSNSSYVGGQVRQYGNLSFSRIYDAGHTVPSYQPETAFTVFTRIIQGNDIGMGKDVDLSTFGTEGPANSDHANKAPAQPKSTCWIRAINDTCNDNEKRAINQGLGIVKNGMWFAQDSQYTPSASSVLAGKPGSLPTNGPTATVRNGNPTTTSSIALTGVYTATGTPKPTSGASRLLFRVQTRRFRHAERDALLDYDKLEGDQSKEVRTGLIAALAAVGGLLLLLLLLSTCCLCWRHHRSRKHNRRFLGGPRDTPSPLPTSEPATPKLEAIAEPQRRNIVQRIAMRRPSSKKEPTPAAAPVDIERPEDPPSFDEQRRPSRRLSAPMEPIPESASPRPSVDLRRPSGSPPAGGHRLSAHPNAPIIVEEPTPIVQRNAAPPSRAPTELTTEEPPKSRQPSRVASEPAVLVASRKPSAAPSKPASPAPEPEPMPPVQRSASLPPEDVPPEDKAPTRAPTRANSVATEPAASRKPSVLQRMRTGWRHSLGNGEAAPSVIDELNDKAAKEEETAADEGVKGAEERASTPPPRVATQPPPERAPTVKVPERSAPQPSIGPEEGEKARG